MNICLICALVVLQSVVSIKPGLVDFADGETNVRKYEQLREGRTVQTGPKGHVEIGLGWDSLLRLDENSSVMLESLDKTDIAIRIESGTVLFEVPKIDKPNRIRITSGSLKASIDSKGVFRVSGNTIAVMEGKLKVEGTALILQKGWMVR